MKIKIEERWIKTFNKIVNDINKLVKKPLPYIKSKRYERLLTKKDTSIEEKKALLIKELHNLIIKAFSIKENKLKKSETPKIKEYLNFARKIVDKLRDINYYLETTFLYEIGLSKRLPIKIQKMNINQNYLTKKDLEKLEFVVYKLIEKIIIFDNKLLKRFEKKEERIIKEKELEIKDLNRLLKKESDILRHLEAKLPPPDKIEYKLFKRPFFDHWAPRVLALLTAFEHLYQKEIEIFNKLKKNRILKSKIETKIKHLIKEKEEAFKLREARILTSEKITKLDKEWEGSLHSWYTVTRL